MIRRSLLALMVLVFPLPLFAQNDFGVWVNRTQFKSTTESDVGGVQGITGKLEFDQKAGFGVTFNHFSGPNLSTEFGWQQLRGNAKLKISTTSPPNSQSFDVGDLRSDMLTAIVQWHFMPRSFIAPYIGGGAAYFTGGRLNLDVSTPQVPLDENIKFDNKFAFVANAGVNFAVTQRMLIALDARYASYKARDKNDPDPTTNTLKLDPLSLALGIRFRM